jgi:hypothetical protein
MSKNKSYLGLIILYSIVQYSILFLPISIMYKGLIWGLDGLLFIGISYFMTIKK